MSGLLLYGLLYRQRLVPRWLAAWGLLGTVAAMTASFLFMFRLIDLFTSVYINLPLALFEVVFAVWLIAKGFNTNSSVSVSSGLEKGKLP